MSPGRSLERNISAALVGNVAYAVAQFGMLISVARLTSPAELGVYALSLAVLGPVFVFVGLKLRRVLVTEAREDLGFGDFFALRVVMSVLVVAVAVGVVGLGVLPDPAAGTFMAMALYKSFEAQIDIYYGVMQRYERLHMVARSQVARAVGGLVAFVGVLAWTREVFAAISVLALFTMLQVVITARRVTSLGVSPSPSFGLRNALRLIRLTLPLGVSVAVGSLTVNVPHYVIQGYEGPARLGIYAALSYFLVATGTVASSMADAAGPRLANLYRHRDGAGFIAVLRNLSVAGFVVGLLGVVVAALVGKPILLVLFGREYAEESHVLVLLMVAALVQYSYLFIGTAVTAIRLFAVQMPISVAGLIAVTAISLVAVPRASLGGAALAVLGGQVVQAGWYGLLVWRAVLPRVRGGQ